MAIHFSKERWDQVKEDYTAWWDGKLDRHILNVTIHDAFDDSRVAKAPMLEQKNVHDFSHSPEDLIEAMDIRLSKIGYLGGAFPFVGMERFGPGVLAAFCGAKLDNSSGGVWFFPQEKREIADIHVEYDPNNIWVNRIKDIYRAGIKKWGNMVAFGLPDFGGVLDVAATFRETEDLLMDLYDEPDEVLRLISEIEVAWYQAYEDFTKILTDAGIVYSYWNAECSKTPSYILQCDFSYMIGPDMFDKFVLPTLQRDCKKLDHTIYHLDGIGELPHLDSLLSIKELDAVQWVYGDGQPSARHWLEVYEKIARAGKRIQLCGDLEDLRVLGGIYDRGMYFSMGMSVEGAAAAGVKYDLNTGKIQLPWE